MANDAYDFLRNKGFMCPLCGTWTVYGGQHNCTYSGSLPINPLPPDAAQCAPAPPLTEFDVRRIVRDELIRMGVVHEGQDDL